MRFDIITLFPELIEPFLVSGINRRAFESKQIDVHLWQLRDFAKGNYKRVDDRPFGGGPGMVMMAEPLHDCLTAINAARHAQQEAASALPVLLFSPIGQTLSQEVVTRWANPSGEFSSGAVLICGRYEGLDQRFVDRYVTHQISLGDFVLSGGEIAAAAFLDAIARLQVGVLGDAQSHQQDSFNPALDGLLDHPHYTRPEVWQGLAAPPVLMSGDHTKIEAWRKMQRLSLTQQLRPDLLSAS